MTSAGHPSCSPGQGKGRLEAVRGSGSAVLLPQGHTGQRVKRRAGLLLLRTESSSLLGVARDHRGPTPGLAVMIPG